MPLYTQTSCPRRLCGARWGQQRHRAAHPQANVSVPHAARLAVLLARKLGAHINAGLALLAARVREHAATVRRRHAVLLHRTVQRARAQASARTSHTHTGQARMCAQRLARLGVQRPACNAEDAGLLRHAVCSVPALERLLRVRSKVTRRLLVSQEALRARKQQREARKACTLFRLWFCRRGPCAPAPCGQGTAASSSRRRRTCRASGCAGRRSVRPLAAAQRRPTSRSARALRALLFRSRTDAADVHTGVVQAARRVQLTRCAQEKGAAAAARTRRRGGGVVRTAGRSSLARRRRQQDAARCQSAVRVLSDCCQL